MIKKLFYKEMKLTANPLSYCFIAFSAMTIIPRYPILIGSFFICLGIFHTYQQIREYDDVTYTVMLPIKKQDAVTAKYLFALFIEMTAFILCALLTLIRMKSLGNTAPYVANPMMNANPAYLGYIMMIFAAFNRIFIAGFFKTTYKIGKPFLIFCTVSLSIIIMGETLHHIPGWENLNDSANITAAQIVILTAGIIVFLACTWFSYQKAVKDFEKIDL